MKKIFAHVLTVFWELDWRRARHLHLKIWNPFKLLNVLEKIILRNLQNAWINVIDIFASHAYLKHPA